MKTTIAAIAAIALATLSAMPAYAEGLTLEDCETAAQVAEHIMYLRQTGAPVTDVMEAAGGHEYVERMVLEAYSHVRMTTPSMQQSQIDTFKHEIERRCIRALYSGG